MYVCAEELKALSQKANVLWEERNFPLKPRIVLVTSASHFIGPSVGLSNLAG